MWVNIPYLHESSYGLRYPPTLDANAMRHALIHWGVKLLSKMENRSILKLKMRIQKTRKLTIFSSWKMDPPCFEDVFSRISIWVFPKIGVPPNHPWINRGFPIICTIHFRGNPPFKETPIWKKWGDLPSRIVVAGSASPVQQPLPRPQPSSQPQPFPMQAQQQPQLATGMQRCQTKCGDGKV